MGRILFILPFALLGIYAVYAAFRYTRMISNIFLSLVYNPPQEVFASSMGEKVSILDSADREIEGLLVEKKGARRTVIFCHESGAAKESWEKYAYFLPSAGYHLLSIDFHGAPDAAEANALSQWPTREDVDRLLTVIRWAKQAWPEAEIVLFGISNGADIAFAASFEEPSVKAVIADGLFSMKEIFRDYIRKWAPILVKPNLFGKDYPDWIVHIFSDLGFWYSQRRSGRLFIDLERLLRQKHVPLLMIHGEEDEYVPPAHQKYLEKMNLKNNVLYRLIIPNAKHNEAVMVGRQHYEESILEFLDTLS